MKAFHTLKVNCGPRSDTMFKFNFIYIAHLQTATRLAKVLHSAIDITHTLKNTHVHHKIEFKEAKMRVIKKEGNINVP